MRTPLVVIQDATQAPGADPALKRKKMLTLADIDVGDQCRITRVAIDDAPCRRRLAELGIAEGMVVGVSGAGDTMMLAMGASRFGLARSCACHIQVVRLKKAS